MIEKLVRLEYQAGLFRNGTKYQARNRWYDANLVRWFEEAILPVGGWTAVLDNATPPAALSVTGFPRGAHAWRGNNDSTWLAVGTHSKLYAYSDGALTDITPASGFVTGTVDGAVAQDIAAAYGLGAYGAGVYSAGSSARTIVEADTWAIDNFGEFLVAVLTSDQKLLVWDRITTNDAAVAAGSPSCQSVVVTPEHFVFALGAGGNVRKVQWPSQGTTTDWTPTAENSAGEEELTTDGRLMAGARLRRQTIIWSDADLQAALYVGGEFIYRFEQVGANCGLMGPNAFALAGGAAYWMSDRKFFFYDGAVQEIRCDVSDDVFNDLNITQRAKVFAMPLPQYNEIWWFFPSMSQSGLENDRYVVYNYKEGHWAVGRVARAAGVGRGVFATPILVKSTGQLLQHETGFDYEGDLPFAESGPAEIGDGDQFMNVQHIVPDEKNLGDVTATFFVANYPTDTERTVGPISLATPSDVRFVARQARVRFEQVREGWRVGVMRFGVIPAGRR